MTKILLPVDGSKHALRAARQLIGITQQWLQRPEIVPLFVHLPVPRIGGISTVVGASTLRDYYRTEGEAALAPVERLLAKAGHAVKSGIQVGPIADTIVEYAKRQKCDMICVGTRGMTAAANLVMGSVATKVLHLADVPVIVIK